MKNIIFIIGSVSSGKSTIAKLIKGSVIIEIDDIYESNLGGKAFDQAYSSNNFQRICWNEFYNKIKANKVKNKSVVALTTGLNPKFKSLLKKLKKELPGEIYVIKLNSKKENVVNRTRQRKGAQKRKVLATLDTYKKLEENNIKSDFVIENDQGLDNLQEKVSNILNLLKSYSKK
jgi:dephospho-CoA kinase